jgi:probable rRNA maturation factor
MTHTIDLQIDPHIPDAALVNQARLEFAALKVLALQGIEAPSSLAIVISTDDEMQRLNQEYRRIAEPTDILSFPADPLPDELLEEGESDYLGDILIGLAYTQRRAQAEGHALDDELILLTVHGVLHLLGFDHDTPAAQAEMWAHQAQALEALGVALVVPDYIHDSA